MNILFDLTPMQPVSASGADFHGGGEYAKTVFLRLCQLLPANTSLEVFYDPRRNIEKSIIETCKARQFTIYTCRNNADISKLLREKNYDVFYSALPYSYTDLILPAKTKFVYTIHGFRNLEILDDKYQFRYKKNNLKEKTKHILFLLIPSWLRAFRNKKVINNFNKLFSLTSNQTIITVSYHSKYSIAWFFPKINSSQIRLLYSPPKICNLSNNKNTEILNSFSLESGKYILLICGDRSEKGAYRACRVLHKLIKKHGGIPEDIRILVLGVSYKKTYRALTENSRRFELRDYVSTEDLEILYKNACLFMFPTFNEGFGYPPLEAMKYGTLCACSANSAITEVCGDSVLYFNPFDETEMGIRILQSFDSEVRKEKAEKMTARYQLIGKKQEHDLDTLIKDVILCNMSMS
jgi:glycosyltransferase involved in cell wall biosynthesis